MKETIVMFFLANIYNDYKVTYRTGLVNWLAIEFSQGLHGAIKRAAALTAMRNIT